MLSIPYMKFKHSGLLYFHNPVKKKFRTSLLKKNIKINLMLSTKFYINYKNNKC